MERHYPPEIKFHILLFICAIIIYSITAFYSSGYLHPDEHYQLIEFAGILDGANESKDMAWEYHEEIRPTIQPVIAYFIFQLCESLSITDSYSKAFILRLLTSFLSLSAICYFANSCKNIIPDEYWKLFIVLSYFLWFLPCLNVRFSSETWSGVLLLLATSLILRNYRSIFAYGLIGGVLGLSFLFRYQVGLSILGLTLWLIFIRRERLFNVSISLLSALIVISLGVVIDSWYYGSTAIVPINYLIVNLIEGKASTFGTSPWYSYFLFILRYSFFPIGITILSSLIIVTTKKAKSPIVWIILPFIIGHSFISHKELRFLFPIINLAPLLIIMSLDTSSINKWRLQIKRAKKYILSALLLTNIFCLVISCLKPAGAGRARITKQIHQLNNRERLDVIYSKDNNPYSPWGMTTNFYKEDNARFIKAESYTDSHTIEANTRVVLVFNKSELNNPNINGIINDLNLTETCRSVPDFIVPFLKIYGYKTDGITIVYSTE